MRPLLILGVFALLASWLMWPDQSAKDVVQETTATTPESPPAEVVPDLATGDDSPLVRAAIVKPVPLVNPPVPPQKPTEEPTEGTVYGQIVNSLGVPLSEGSVLVFDHSKQIASVDIQGNQQQYSVELAAGKYYGFMVDPTSLTGGYLPALRRSRDFKMISGPSNLNSPEYFAKSNLKVEPGLSQQLNLMVSLPASVSGRVTDSTGSPIEGVQARVSGAGEQDQILSMDALTDAQGYFQIKEISSGEFRLALYTDPAKTPADGSWNTPPAHLFTLSDGQQYDFGEIQLGAGSHSLHGKIVNQDGDPFPGRMVLCFSSEKDEDGFTARNLGVPLTRVITDEDGRFEMRALSSDYVLLSASSDFYPGQAMGPGKPAMWEHPLKVDLTAGNESVDIGEMVVHESRPFEISGNLVFDPAWLQQTGHEKKDLQITLSQVEGEELPEGIRRNPIKNSRVRIDWKTGNYSYLIETPMTAVRITFSLPGYRDLRFVVHPQPLQSKARNLQIPADFGSLGNR